ncbi:MAG TPA: site-specific integrase [Caldisericia bacterium]|mgnify:CR=1 FL=1|nr:site-specific integrase [Caldisericia bacterium]HPF49141.1 site-specific integrase [Caldisericia bacterium]HPI82995.1 site-specific integrase [Caldisericia bacterium]HPQ92222.1 site-specific integrase [Caldisericia bacterium]HRV74680.1 site-specific integrase [Caldisericia bacterium]
MEFSDVNEGEIANGMEVLSDNTNTAYKSGWSKFVNWCSLHDFSPLPAEPATVAAWLASLADEGKKASSIDTWRSAVRKIHRNADLPDPTEHEQVKNAMRSIKRKIGSAKEKKTALLADDIKSIVDTLGNSLIDLRDKALVLWGYAGAFRRSELVGIQISDITRVDKGFKVLIRRSKTDQEGKGMEKAIFAKPGSVYCPVKAFEDWIRASKIKDGHVFRHINKHGELLAPLQPPAVNTILKKLVIPLGFDPNDIGGHSLRAGFVTELIKKRAPVHKIMVQTGHKNYQTLREYIRTANLFEDNAAESCLD